MRNLLTSTTSVGNVVCIVDLLETIVPDLQRTTYQTYAIQPIVQLTTVVQFFGNWQLSARVRRCPWPFKIIRVSRCIGAVSKRYGFLFSTSSRRKATPSPVKFSFFFVFKFVDILCILQGSSWLRICFSQHFSQMEKVGAK